MDRVSPDKKAAFGRLFILLDRESYRGAEGAASPKNESRFLAKSGSE
jgi:hypothetical protein